MDMEETLGTVRSFDGVLVLAPDEGSGAPELAWGDVFVYHSPDGRVPTNVQPYATIVTKDYPDDRESDLDPEGRWRVNIHVGRARLAELAADEPGTHDPSEADVVLPHPVYGSLGWVAVVNPGQRTGALVLELLGEAHEAARRRAARRSVARPDGVSPGP